MISDWRIISCWDAEDPFAFTGVSHAASRRRSSSSAPLVSASLCLQQIISISIAQSRAEMVKKNPPEQEPEKTLT